MIPFAFEAPPTPVILAPSKGVQTGGTIVRISLYRQANVSCNFGGIVVLATPNDDEQGCTCISPASPIAGLVSLTLMENNSPVQGSESLRFEYYKSPEVLAINPIQGPMSGGTAVTVVGRNLPVQGLQCRFGDFQTSVSNARFLSSSVAICLSPSVPSSQTATLLISGDDGLEFFNSLHTFAFKDSAKILELRPSAGLAGKEGQLVTVVGTDLPQGDDVLCYFGVRMLLKGLRLSTSTILCQVPMNQVGSVLLTVDPSSEGAKFIYVDHPRVVSVSPTTGPTSGDSLVSVTLATDDFADQTGKCAFGESLVLADQIGTTKYTCRSPHRNLQGPVQFGFYVGGYLATNTAIAFEYFPDARIGHFHPSEGPMTGGTVISIVGQAFWPDLCCVFAGRAMDKSSARWLSSTLVACTSPSYDVEQSVSLEVSNNGGYDTSQDGKRFTYGMQATVLALRPSHAVVSNSDIPVTVFGAHFADSATVSCRFGQRSTVHGNLLSSSSLLCIAPARFEGI
eukprot:763627-Rhodomonas_salina.1